MKIIVSLVALAALMALAISCVKRNAKDISVPEGALLIDVRTQPEHDVKHLAGAVLVPYPDDNFVVEIKKVVSDKNKPIALFCRSGRRSGLAQDVLKGAGYTQVFNLGSLESAAENLQLEIVFPAQTEPDAEIQEVSNATE